MNADIDTLKQAFLAADQEYQFALASGDMPRVKRSLTNWRKAFAAYDKAKRAQFKKASRISK